MPGAHLSPVDLQRLLTGEGAFAAQERDADVLEPGDLPAVVELVDPGVAAVQDPLGVEAGTVGPLHPL